MGAGRNPGVLGVWGPDGKRVIAAESYWKKPLRWNREAARQRRELEAAGVKDLRRPRVFCASYADWLEDWNGFMDAPNGAQMYRRTGSGEWTTSDHYRDTIALTMRDARIRLLRTIMETPELDWLLLTKRPENFNEALHQVVQYDSDGVDEYASAWLDGEYPDNVWIGTTVENQKYAFDRNRLLHQIPARVHFWSYEPALGPVNIYPYCPSCDDHESKALVGCDRCGSLLEYPDWVIMGGESGPHSRVCELEWFRNMIVQCRIVGSRPFMKQLGACASDEKNGIAGHALDVPEEARGLISLRLVHKKGGEISEWPVGLRVRELPDVFA